MFSCIPSIAIAQENKGDCIRYDWAADPNYLFLRDDEKRLMDSTRVFLCRKHSKEGLRLKGGPRLDPETIYKADVLQMAACGAGKIREVYLSRFDMNETTQAMLARFCRQIRLDISTIATEYERLRVEMFCEGTTESPIGVIKDLPSIQNLHSKALDLCKLAREGRIDTEEAQARLKGAVERANQEVPTEAAGAGLKFFLAMLGAASTLLAVVFGLRKLLSG